MKIPVKAVILLFLLIFISNPLTHGQESGREEDIKNERARIDQKKLESMAFSQKGNFELGGCAGTPSGLNARYWVTNELGLDFSIGSTLQRDFYLSADFLYEFIDLYSSMSLRLRTFAGAGALAGYQDKESYGNIRFPLGMSMPFVNYPLTLSFFVAPAFNVTNKMKFNMNWGIAARFNFGIAEKINEREGSLKRELTATREGYDRLKGKLDSTIGELDKSIGELNKTRGELSSTKGQLDKTINRLSGTKEELDSASKELHDTRGKLLHAADQIVSMKKELDTAKTELDAAKEDLNRTKSRLDSKESELIAKQIELNNSRTVIKAELKGREKDEEEKKVLQKQEELNREMEKFKKEKQSWEKNSEKQKTNRVKLKSKCEARRGIINEDGYCDCREHEQWNSDKSECVCVKGYKLNPASDRCEPCETVNYFGACSEGCAADEKTVPLEKGPHKYVCVKKCRGKNETWSERKSTCVCKDGYYRDANGECVPRR